MGTDSSRKLNRINSTGNSCKINRWEPGVVFERDVVFERGVVCRAGCPAQCFHVQPHYCDLAVFLAMLHRNVKS